MSRPVGKTLLALIALLAICCIWFSIDFYAMVIMGKGSAPIDDRLYSRPFSLKIPSIFELLCLAFAFLVYSGGAKRSTPFSPAGAFFVWFSMVMYLLVLINPNSPLGILQRASESIPILLFPLLIAVLLKIDEDFYPSVAVRLFTALTIVASARSIWLVAKFLAGKGSYAYGNVNATLSEGDVLYFISFLQVVLLGLFLAQGRRTYLLASLLLLTVVVFSFRRTWVALSLFPTIGLLVLNACIGTSFGKKLVAMVALFSVLFVLTFQVGFLRDLLGVYADRYGAILYVFRENPNKGLSGDSGHYFEATFSMAYALSNIQFFGVGMGGKFPVLLALESWSASGVHNVYADVLIRHGIAMFGLLVAMIVYSAALLIRLLARANALPREYVFTKLSILLYILVFFGVLFYNATWFTFDFAKFNFLLAPIFTLLIRFRPENYEMFLGSGAVDEPDDSQGDDVRTETGQT